MAKKPTKKQRIEQKVTDGMTRLDAELEVAREDAQALVARAEARVKKEQQRIDAAAVRIIRERYPEIWERAVEEARDIVLGRSKRSVKVSAEEFAEASAEMSADAGMEGMDDLLAAAAYVEAGGYVEALAVRCGGCGGTTDNAVGLWVTNVADPFNSDYSDLWPIGDACSPECVAALLPKNAVKQILTAAPNAVRPD